MDNAIRRSVGLQRALLGVSTSGVIVDEQEEFAHALRDRDETEPLVSKRRPAGDPKELHGREGALDTFGKAQPPLHRGSNSDGTKAETAKRTLGSLEAG